MPNIQQVMSEEIRRLARKELKTELTEMKKQFAAMRKLIVEQNRHIKALEKLAPAPVATPKAAPQPTDEAAPSKAVRITADRIRKLREKLGLPQSKFAVLLGVNLHSVHFWEAGKTEPRDAQKRKIAAIRDMGKRELAKLMAEKNIAVKSAKTLQRTSRTAMKVSKPVSDEAKTATEA